MARLTWLDGIPYREADTGSPPPWENAWTGGMVTCPRLSQTLYETQARQAQARAGKLRKPGRPIDIVRNRKILELAQQHRKPDGTPNQSKVHSLTGASLPHIRSVLRENGMLE